MADFIERDALIRRCRQIIQDPWNHETAPVSWADAYRQFIDDIDEMDAAEVRPDIHGMWEVNRIYTKCSVCGEAFMLIPQNFCPHCGSRMNIKGDTT